MPNFFVLVLDDYRAAPDGDGNRIIDNCPNLLQTFETEGTYFPNYFCTTPICAPSRASMYSGRYAEQHGIQINEDARDKEFLDWYSFQRVLQQAGYDPGLMHKYLWSSKYDPYNPELPVNPANRPNWFEHRYQAGPTRDEAEHDVSLATKFLEPHLTGDDTRPWLLMFCPNIPHAGYGAEPVDAYTPVPFVDLDSNFETPEQVAKKAPSNRGDVSDETRAVGAADWAGMEQEMVALDQQWPNIIANFTTDQREDTVFIMVTDNGYQLGEHGLTRKQYPYLESCQLNLWISAITEGVAEGATDNRLCANIDICPTILELAGLTDAYPYSMGLDLLGAEERTELYTSLPGGGSGGTQADTWRALITSTTPYVGLHHHYIETPQEDGSVWTEHYDLTGDPLEMDAENTPVQVFIDALEETQATLSQDLYPSTGSEANVCV